MSTFFEILGAFWFLYFYWYRLKEDYSSDEIFRSGFFSLIGFFIGGFAPFILKSPQYIFWGNILGLLIGFLLSRIGQKIRFFESLEALGIGYLVILFFQISAIFLQNPLPVNIILFLAIQLHFLLFLFLDARYKRFSWYKSGRVGLAGILTLGVFFLMRGVLSFFLNSNMLFSLGKIDSLVSAATALILFFLVFRLSKN